MLSHSHSKKKIFKILHSTPLSNRMAKEGRICELSCIIFDDIRVGSILKHPVFSFRLEPADCKHEI